MTEEQLFYKCNRIVALGFIGIFSFTFIDYKFIEKSFPTGMQKVIAAIILILVYVWIDVVRWNHNFDKRKD